MTHHRPDPSAHGVVTATNWLESSNTPWSLHHVEEVIATVAIPAGNGAVRNLAVEHEASEWPDIASFCRDSYTDAMIVLVGDAVVFDYRAASMTSGRPHLAMSVSKSICAMVCGSVAQSVHLDLDRSCRELVPELAHSAFASATVRDLLDMAVPVEFDMDHTNPDSDVAREDRAAGWRPQRPSDPRDTREFLTTIRTPEHSQGQVFEYCSATTDVLAWVLERVTDTAYPKLLSEVLWSQLGAERDAYVTVDSSGIAYACAGLGMAIEDLARFGRLMLQGGSFQGRQVIPEGWIADTFAGGDPGRMTGHPFGQTHPKGSYHNQWWATGDDHGSVFASGLHGQYLWLDPVSDVTIAKFSCVPGDLDPKDDHAAQFRTIANRQSTSLPH